VRLMVLPARRHCSGVCSPPIGSTPQSRPRKSYSFTAYAGASSRSSAPSKAMVLRSTTANSSTPNACLTLAAMGLAGAIRTIQLVDARDGSHDLLPTSSSLRSMTLSCGSPKNSRAKPCDRRTRILPPSLAFVAMDHGTAWWLELLLQTTRTQDNARRLEQIGSNPPRVRPGSGPRKSVNPVGLRGEVGSRSDPGEGELQHASC